jgi:serine/threonine-protein phosphatase 2A catalytic subunit
MCDLLWSYPFDPTRWATSFRVAGFYFRADITEQFNHNIGLKFICRAHQIIMEGFSIAHQDNIVTVFSAPNYCYRCRNQAAIMQVPESLEVDYLKFHTAPKKR